MTYKLIASLRYQQQLDALLGYVAKHLHNKTAAKSIYKDVLDAYGLLKEFPAAMELCRDEFLALKSYRKLVLKHHDYVILFRIENDKVLLDGIFHGLEQYIDKV